MDDELMARYQRQVLFSGLGEDGQRRLLRAAVVQVGCGALGSTLAACLVRSGVGAYSIIDSDRAELGNLHRQLLFDEDDVAAAAAKATAAAKKLGRAQSSARIVGHVARLDKTNADALLAGHALVVDATDNLETRYLINDWCVKNKVPWIYGAVAGASGMTMTITPQFGPCLRCLFPDPNARGAVNTDTVGVINVAPVVIAALQATEAIKLLIGSRDLIRGLRVIDLWTGVFQRETIRQNPACPCCGKGRYDFL